MLITESNKLHAYTAEKRIWQGIPSVEITGGGRLFATFYSGQTTETYGNYCVLVKSDDGGAHWSEPIAVADAGMDTRCFDPEIWLDPFGKLWFTWSQWHPDAVYAAVCDNPDADTLIWQEPRVIGADVMMNKPIVLSGGEWLFPIAVWKHTLYGLAQNDKDCRSFVYQSIDNGMHFSCIGGADDPASTYDEHTVAELSNGAVMMLIRTGYGIGKSLSYDGGKTWTPAENSGIPGPNSRCCLRRLQSGNLLLINHHQFSGRNNLTAMISRDNGETWEGFLLLDGRQNVSYPDVTQAPDGTIYVIYDRERGAAQPTLKAAQACAREILLAKIREEDIFAGALVSENSTLAAVVSRLGEYTGEDIFSVKRKNREHLMLLDCLSTETDCEKIADEIFRFWGNHCAAFTSEKAHAIDTQFTKLVTITDAAARRAVIARIIDIINEGRPEATPMYEYTEATPIVNQAIAYLHHHFHETVTLESLAEALSVSMFYLSHVFKRHTALTVIEYLLSLRLSEAKKLLRTTDLRVTDIALACGYNSITYFSKVFRDNVGCSPTEYRG